MPDDTRKLLWKADELPAQERAVTQRLNPNSHLLRTGLSRLAGLQRAHVSLGRIPPGKDSFAYHAHMVEEEWVYILSGRGLADIAGKQYEVGPGDFMGFPAPSVAHHLRNTGAEELVYLMGGESLDAEVARFPGLGKTMVRVGDRVEIYDSADAKGFGAED